MVLDGVLCSVIHFGRVILYAWSSPFLSVFCGRLQTSAGFSLDMTLLIQYVLYFMFSMLLILPLARVH